MISSTGTGDGPSSSSITPSASSPFIHRAGSEGCESAERERALAIGRIASTTSAAFWISVAPSRISWLQPCARGSSGEPGTAITSRPASAASRAVISEPDRGAASTTTVPALRPGDDPVAVGEVPRPRLGARRHFGDHQPALGHRLLPRLVLGRVEDVDAAGDDADRASLQRAVVRRAVDAAGKARHDDQVVLPELVGKPARKAARGGRSVARADDRHRRAGRAG